MTRKEIKSLSELNDLAAQGHLFGLYRVPSDLYHAGPGISSTGIKELLRSPAHYQAFLAGRKDTEAMRRGRLAGRKDTEAMRRGRLVHTRILEPEVYAKTAIVMPEFTGLTKDGKESAQSAEAKAKWQAWLDANQGKEIITQAEKDQHDRYWQVVQGNKLARQVFSGGEAEVSCYWIDDATGVLCKARADYLRGNAIFDLKTTSYSARPEDFAKTVKTLSYHVSAAFYLDGFSRFLGTKHFSWVALETASPHCIGFCAAEQELLNAGRADYTRALETLVECQRSGVWSGYPEKFVNITLAGSLT